MGMASTGTHFPISMSIPTQIVRAIYTKIVKNVNILGDPEVTVNIYCKSRNLLNTDTQNYSTDLR